MIKGIIIDYISYRLVKNKELNMQKSEENIKKIMETWVERINNKPFHGGDVPDAADFRVINK
jgi:hypothetical protein